MQDFDSQEILDGDISIIKYKNDDGSYDICISLENLYKDKIINLKIPRAYPVDDDINKEILLYCTEIPKIDRK